MKRLLCWFFGCRPHPQDPAPIEHLTCDRCGASMDYESLAGCTRWSVVKEWCQHWLFRRWFPARCGDCGKRYGAHDGCLPF